MWTLGPRGSGITWLSSGSLPKTQTNNLCASFISGNFAPASNIAVPRGATKAEIGDFNHDGIHDIAAMSEEGWLSVLIGIGGGNFTPAVEYAPNAAAVSVSSSLAVGDFNGDGTDDVIVLNFGSTSLLLGTGTGGFGSRSDFSFGVLSNRGAGSPIAVGDFNGDGKQDIAEAVGTSGSVYGPSVVVTASPACLLATRRSTEWIATGGGSA